MKKTLIIHPKDATTDFMKVAYEDVPYKTIITGEISQQDVHKEIMNHDRIIMIGHGSPYGLFNVSNFKTNEYIININSVPFLKHKENIMIWCDADALVNEHNLKGFYTGMFISELAEAVRYNIETTEEIIASSNNVFAAMLGSHINDDIETLYKNVKEKYAKFAISRVAEFNQNRLYFK
jgi:hypothetical protein